MSFSFGEPMSNILEDLSDFNNTPTVFNEWNGMSEELNGDIYQQHQYTWNQQPSVIHSTPSASVPVPYVYASSSTYSSPSNQQLQPEALKPGKRPTTGKPKRVRTAFTSEQILGLEAVFRKTSYVSRADRTHLSQRLALDDRAIKVWFQNRRMKKKKESGASSESSSPPLLEVPSSSTEPIDNSDPHTEHIYEYQLPMNHDPYFSSHKAQATFTRATIDYQEYYRQQQQHYQPTTHAVSNQNVLETFQYDNVSPVQYYPEQNVLPNDYYETYSQTSPYLGAETPITEASSILYKIEQDIAASQCDSGLVSMNSDSLDELGVLINQRISDASSVAAEVSAYTRICDESVQLTESALNGSPAELSTMPTSSPGGTLLTFIDLPKTNTTVVKIEPDEDISHNVNSDSNDVVFDNKECVRIFNVADIPLPPE